MASVCVVAALAASLPTVLAAALLLSELAFGLVGAPVRYHQLDQKFTHSSGKGEHHDDEGSWLQDGLGVLQQLLDPTEGHAELLRGDGEWFNGWWSGDVKASELGRTNVAQFLSYIIFSGRLGDKAAHMLQQAAETFIAAVGLDVGKHHNPQATFVSHTEEPLKVHYRPLLFYLMTETVAGISHLLLTRMQGFTIAAKNSVATFYIKRAPAGATEQPPLVFLHGIGLGLAPYTTFIKRLAAQHPDRTVIAVQYRHVSMRLTTHIPTATEVADTIAQFLATVGYTRVNLIAHSYGTLVASSLAKKYSSLLAGLTLIDPVCFAMFLPHLVVNTLHFDAKTAVAQAQAKPFSLRGMLSPRALMKGLVLREMHCAAAMSRRLRWPEVNLWTSEVPANTTVVLGGSDNMIPVAEIHQLLTSPAAAARGINVIHNADHGHGAFVLDLDLQQQIITNPSVTEQASGTALPADAVAAPGLEIAAAATAMAQGGAVADAASPLELVALMQQAFKGIVPTLPKPTAPSQREAPMLKEDANKALRKMLAGGRAVTGRGPTLGLLAPLRCGMAAAVCRRQLHESPALHHKPSLRWVL